MVVLLPLGLCIDDARDALLNSIFSAGFDALKRRRWQR